LEVPDRQQKKKAQPQKPKLIKTKWVLTITVVSFFVSMIMSYASSEALNNAGTLLSFVVLFVFIGLGIVFDMIGVASTSATEKEFHSMAAHKVRGAREAVWMTRNAEKVSSICNDVVGDICGIISGATGALIVARITAGLSGARAVLLSLLVTGMVSAATIGGKAAGKGIAIAFSSKVLAMCGRVLSVLPITLDGKK
jgi:CBS domain containing-hemolysin-like protein